MDPTLDFNELLSKKKTEIMLNVEQKKEWGYLGSMRNNSRGLKLWVYNIYTNEIKEAGGEYVLGVEQKIWVTPFQCVKTKAVKRKINCNQGEKYFFALNYKNARKKMDSYLEFVKGLALIELKREQNESKEE